MESNNKDMGIIEAIRNRESTKTRFVRLYSDIKRRRIDNIYNRRLQRLNSINVQFNIRI